MTNAIKLISGASVLAMLLCGCSSTVQPKQLDAEEAPAVSSQELSPTDDTVTVYNNGVYEGTAQVDEPDYSYTATATVTISNGLITDIQVSCDSPENELYMKTALNGMGEDMITGQSTDVDIKSGATASSDALIAAVNDALSKAGTTTQAAVPEAPVAVDKLTPTPETSIQPVASEDGQLVEILGTTYYFGGGESLDVDGQTVTAQQISDSGVYYYCAQPLTGTVYGTSDLSFADFYYGEMNEVETADEIAIASADALADYRDSGMYDAVTSATNNKWKQSSAYYTQSLDGGGGEILGVAAVSVAVDVKIYAQAMILAAAGLTDENGIITRCQAFAVSDDQTQIPIQYKTLYANGLYSALNCEGCDASALTYTSATITNQSRYGTHQINLSGGQGGKSGATVIGVILETDDEAMYGLKQLENIWQNGRELAISTRVNRFADMTGKTIVKITFLCSGQQSYTMDVNLTVE